MLMVSGRRGFTLIELMLALVMVLVVAGVIHQLLVGSSRAARQQAERIALQSSVRGAALVASNELRQVSAVPEGAVSGSDLIRLGPHAVSYRAARGFGYTCQGWLPGVLRFSRAVFTGHRDPQAGRDSVLVYLPGVPTPADSDWIPLGIDAVSSAGTCPEGSSAITLSVSGPGGPGSPASGTPIRIYEPVELALYRSENKSWLGMRSLRSGEAIQPLFGPLEDLEGFRLEYTDASGLITGTPAAVRSITISLRAVSDPDHSPETIFAEELTAQVALRDGAY